MAPGEAYRNAQAAYPPGRNIAARAKIAVSDAPEGTFAFAATFVVAGVAKSETHHARDNTHYYSCSITCRRAAHLAVLNWLGLLPRRRTGPHPDYCNCFSFDGTSMTAGGP